MLQPEQQHPFLPVQGLTKGFFLALGGTFLLNYTGVFLFFSLQVKLCSHAQKGKARMHEV